MMKVSIHQEYITIINVNVPENSFKIDKAKIESTGDIDNHNDHK